MSASISNSVEKRVVGRLSPFPHPWFTNWAPNAPPAQPLNHWRMQEMSNAIRSKPDWQRKYKDVEISRKWRNEIRQQYPDLDLMDKMFDYVLEELKWVEKMENEYPGMKTSGFVMECDDRIVSSVTAIDETTRHKFVQQVQSLHDSFGEEIDYHPGSKNQVIDLIHPSLFPVQYGTTVTKDDKGDYKIAEFSSDIPMAKDMTENSEFGVSKKFQWLPTPLTLNNKTGLFQFSSYINNLHPVQHKELYNTLETIFNKTLPGLNFTLARFASPVYERVDEDVYTNPYQTHGKESMWDHMNALEEAADADPSIDFEDEWKLRVSKYMREIFSPYNKDPETVNFDLKEFGEVKVITKIATIELTPEDPVYEGGSWHVEGTVNEDIVATIIYYFDSENITTSKLSFRTGFGEPMYEQGDDLGVEFIFGLQEEQLLVRNIGEVTSETNKVVIWPNLFQHHVERFELADKSKKGHRKIMCFFICDPYNDQVLATDKVPMQRKDWWDDATLGMTDEEKAKISKASDGKLLQTLEQAFKIREELMAERAIDAELDPDDYSEMAYRTFFNLCEH
ncbi:hypothetical protein BON22_3575 [Cyberlindnera fabianii]|uniref:Uncharacterized protein n=1 Tax=Cyberlindnera fabianii TaxID=36022 RepID=A0A1V2L4A8_CYBFA|nr:hypothetical protein BON22_3575 [Cyberlindnera fabianii]